MHNNKVLLYYDMNLKNSLRSFKKRNMNNDLLIPNTIFFYYFKVSTSQLVTNVFFINLISRLFIEWYKEIERDWSEEV
jgi:hypothetical protein